MLYQVFLEQMPYCVEYHNETNSIVVKNRDYQTIYEGLVLSDLDCKSASRSFACPLDDCFRENTE